MRTVRVGRVEEFEDRGRKVISVDDTEVGVFRLGDEFFAWENVCAHQGGPVCQGRVINLVIEPVADDNTVHGRAYDDERVNIVCPWHGYEYDIRTGRHPGNPDIALTPVEVQVQNDEVFLLL